MVAIPENEVRVMVESVSSHPTANSLIRTRYAKLGGSLFAMSSLLLLIAGCDTGSSHRAVTRSECATATDRLFSGLIGALPASNNPMENIQGAAIQQDI